MYYVCTVGALLHLRTLARFNPRDGSAEKFTTASVLPDKGVGVCRDKYLSTCLVDPVCGRCLASPLLCVISSVLDDKSE